MKTSTPQALKAHAMAFNNIPVRPKAIAHNSTGYVIASESGASFIFRGFRGGRPEKYFGTLAGALRHLNAAAIQSATL